MKANKALKRLAKIEALASDVTRRFSASAPHVKEVLESLKEAVARVKQAVSEQVSSERPKKKAGPARKKKAAKKTAIKAPKAKTGNKVTRLKRAAAKQTAPTPAHAKENVGQETTPDN